MKPSARSEVAPFYVMEVMKAAAEREAAGGEVLHLEVGQPVTPAPQGAIGAAQAALSADRLGYTPALGVDQLRRRIVRHYADAYGVVVPVGRVAVTIGASGGMILALLAALDPGARVGITEPGYAAYRNMITALDLELVGIRIGPESRWVATPGAIEAAGPLDALVVASPSNPTGTTMTGPELEAVAHYCEAADVRLLSDEIYHGITFERPASTAAEFSDSAVVVQSFSKYYSMTGWRLGWLVLPEDLVRPVEVLAQNLFISPPALSQLAGLAALDCTEELDHNVARYAERRRVVVAGLVAAGITQIAPPDGGFYVWADVSHLTDDSQALCAQWLDELRVAATPGVDFDPEAGHRFVRFSYSESTEAMEEAMRRLAAWVERRPPR
ncbi:MAG TPA: aminotransferase class I/II-fold pyridoxal phosphate-dependent enzyme [Acidimicrobiia bacterium]|jgi:aspartate/methionine/tyrosine aminotransferase|nr:aminotransferase class I/II-fold pyridoxal phosphate-dependent enzyme [Acidimicrobiia bacterium]